MCSAYTFLLTYSSTNIYKAGMWIIVEFSSGITPKLNRKGAIYCEQG